MEKTIFTGYAPNLSFYDLRVALKFIFLPWNWRKWKHGNAAHEAEKFLQDYFSVKNVNVVDSGRSALLISLQVIGVGKGDDVIVQAFTCLVVINAITKLGANPIFVDICRDANMDILDLKKKITPKTKAIIIQHTFGIPAEIEELTSFAKTHSLPVIEDCAHSLGAVLKEKKIGTFGDISILSFGSDKIISCVRGGAIIINNDSFAKKITDLQNGLPDTSTQKIFQHLMHYPIFFLGKKFYHILVGKILLWIAKKINLTNRIIYNEEKRGEPMRDYPSKFPEALAQILLLQFNRLSTIIAHRKLVAKKYEDEIKNPQVVLPCRELTIEKKSGGVYLRYPILTKNPYKLYQHAKNNGIILGNWYDTVVSPYRGVTARIDYLPGSCPNAEYFSKHIVNLPTDIIIGQKEQRRIIDVINSYKEE